MRYLILPALFMVSACGAPSDATPDADIDAPVTAVEFDPISPELAGRFSRLALDCVHKEFPNKVSRTTDTAEEMGTPREIFPAFYGCFDWHSSVHGHWLLVRLLREAPADAPWRDEAIAKLDQSFSPENLAGELANFNRPARGSWERPYGWAWYLQLASELREWQADDDGRIESTNELLTRVRIKQWLSAIEPLEAAIVSATKEWLPKLAYPIHLGTHNQSAFAMTLMVDHARTTGDAEFEALLTDKAKAFHFDQTDCPLAYEPSGEDFLSPCLMTADLMRRVLNEAEFADWLSAFLPDIPLDGSTDWLAPGIVLDASDGKLVHLDGVNSSRAWNLYNIARALPEDDPRRASLIASAGQHRDSGIAAVSDEHYSGSHWLASFATYLVTDRGWDG